MKITLPVVTMLLLLSGCGGGDESSSNANSDNTTDNTNQDTSSNAPPEFLTSELKMKEDETLSLRIADYITDPEQDTFSVEVNQQCSENLRCELAEGLLVITPEPDYYGTENRIPVTVSDNQGRTIEGQFNVVVEAINDAPVFKPADMTINEDQSVQFDLASYVQDVDDNQFTFSIDGCAETLTCAINGNILSLIPNENYHGEANLVTVRVEDPQGAAVLSSFHVNVDSVYDNPTFSVQDISINEDATKKIDLASWYHSEESLPVDFRLTNCPANFTCQLEGSVLTLSPNQDYFGMKNTVAVSSEDSTGVEVSKSFNIAVNPLNDAPRLVINDQSTLEDENLYIELSVRSSDIEGGVLTYRVESCPANVDCYLLDSELVLLPKSNYSGSDNSVTVSATDSQGATTKETFNLIVEMVDDKPEWISVPFQSISFNGSIRVDLSSYVSDVDSSTLTLSLSNCASGITCRMDGKQLVLEKPESANETYHIYVRASDGNSYSDELILVGSERESVASIAGVTFFPPVDSISESSVMNYSLNASIDIENLVINGHQVGITNSSSWQDTLILSEETNVFDITVETATQTTSFTRTFKHQGAFHHGSSDLTYLADGRVLVNDYRRKALLTFDVQTGKTIKYDPSSMLGLPATPESYIVSGQTIVGLIENPDSNEDELYLLDLVKQEATLLYNLTSEGIKVSNMTFSADGRAIYFVYVGAKQVAENSWQQYEEFYHFDMETKLMTFITDTAPAVDDGVLRNIDSIRYSESENRLYLLDRGLGFNDDTSLYSLDLSGVNQDKISRVMMSDNEVCMALDSLELSQANTRSDGAWYLIQKQSFGAVLEMDPINGCVSEVFAMPSTVHESPESLQGFDIDTDTGEMYLGFYSGPIAYNELSDSFRGLEVDGFSGQAWQIDEINTMAVHHQKTQLLFTDAYQLNGYNWVSGELSTKQLLDNETQSVAWDSSLERLYIGDDNGSLHYFDAKNDEFHTLVTSELGHDFEFIALGKQDDLYFVDGDDVKKFDIRTNSIELVSFDDGSAPFYSVTGLLFDEANNRLIVDSEKRRDFRRTYFIAIDITTGARNYLNEPEAVALNIGDAIAWNQDKSAVVYQNGSDDSLYQYDLAAKSVTMLANNQDIDNKLGNVFAVGWFSENVLVLSSYELNGFWLLDLRTNDRVLLR
ncbi:tandem-95 repeat protein [Vibrio alfacsensis]|uniref:tandem-95 repeat protein n=1 Tax=Vibrio alfacsensis TaxID=1074311 RepID=UPI002ADDD7F4|nr:Ig-like domain-containing protein [Vibrio alfacsensis]WQE78388.1 tandem-95 repeat protein [Vibrio alfacsensis]